LARVPKQRQRRLALSETRAVDLPAKKGQIGYYTVRNGDSLSEISYELYGTMNKCWTIAKLNKIKNSQLDPSREGVEISRSDGWVCSELIIRRRG